ncbi:MAG: DNA translocase FtsK 4TM domain-containing protein [Magnetovibrionaceae bacterium]
MSVGIEHKGPFGASRLLPEGAGAYLARRGLELLGLGLIGLVLALGLALFSYNPADPSLNHATTALPSNLFGQPGALVADAVLQAVGLAIVLPMLVLFAWGLGLIIRKRRPRPFGFVLFMALSALILMAAALGGMERPEAWPLHSGLGGVAGYLLFTRTEALVADLGLPGLVVSSSYFVLALACLVLAMAMPWREWRGLGLGLFKGGLFAGRQIGRGTHLAREQAGYLKDRVAAGIEARRNSKEPEVPLTIPRPRQEDLRADDLRTEEASPDLEDVIARTTAEDRLDGEPVEIARTGKVATVAPKAPALKPGKQAAKRAQGRLALEPGDRYEYPPLNLLAAPDPKAAKGINKEALEQNARLLESVLGDFGVRGEIGHVRPGPVVTLYELEPAPGTKTSRVIGLADDIARSMSAVSVRVAVVPGRNVIGIELPNQSREMVHLHELLAHDSFAKSSHALSLALGKDIGGAPVAIDLARTPHMLIAGTTGSGKSVGINAMILSLLYRLKPEECRLIMIDPKMLELSVYDGIPHLLSPVVTDPNKAVVALKWAVREMEDRYRAMSQLGVRNINGFNQRLKEAVTRGEELTRRVQTGFDEDGRPIFEDQPLPTDPLPYIVVVVDEMADLMLVAGKDVEAAIQRLAQMARAAGIHLIMATQRPSVDVITGTIKANFPTRVSFQVTSKIDSRTILGEQGAEQLLGQGDMLYMAGGGRITRVHGPFVSDQEVESIVNHLKAQGEPAYVESVTDESDDLSDIPGFGQADGKPPQPSGDELYDQAVAVVAREGKASTSFVQRHLQIGYNRAARIIERMEKEGVVSKANRTGKREVLVSDHSGAESGL